MKGIPSIQRLKRCAAVAGVGALVLGGVMLGASQADAATTQFGTGTGLTINPATGSANSTPTYTSQACPSGFNGSAVAKAIDPTTAAGTPVSGIAAEQLGAPDLSVTTPFTSSFGETVANLESDGIDIAAGVQFEVAIYCFTGTQANGPGEWGPSTFMTINSDGTYTGDQTLSGPPQAVNITLTANPNPAVAGQSVTLTATTSVAGATGTVQFESGGTDVNGPATISGGTATTSTTFAAAGTEALTAVYTPTGNFTAGTAGSLSLTVGAAPANSGTIPLAVSVPVEGSFTLNVDTKDVVTLTTSGYVATGVTTPISVVDTRNNFPGWIVSGQDSAWTGTGTATGGTFSGNQLGWVPTDTALAQGVTLGGTVAPTAPGLGTAATLASVTGGTNGNGFGTTTLGANLTLDIPTNAPAGPYTSGLTVSAVTSNP